MPLPLLLPLPVTATSATATVAVTAATTAKLGSDTVVDLDCGSAITRSIRNFAESFFLTFFFPHQDLFLREREVVMFGETSYRVSTRPAAITPSTPLSPSVPLLLFFSFRALSRSSNAFIF